MTDQAVHDHGHSEDSPTVVDLFADIDWDARLRAAVEQTLTARLARLETRRALQAARTYGLAGWHAAKEGRIVSARYQEEGGQ